MSAVKINSSLEDLEIFIKSDVWMDIKRELKIWQKAANIEINSIVSDAESSNPSTASVLLHLGDLNGRKKAIDFFLQMVDMFIQIKTKEKEEREEEDA